MTLQLQSLGNGLVHIYSPDVRRYVSMDSNGRLFSTVKYHIPCICLCFEINGSGILFSMRLTLHGKAQTRRVGKP